jgi:uncharacterized protein (TIGR03435 family)
VFIARVLFIATILSPGFYAATAQTAASPPAQATTKPLIFEAVTIRPTKREQYSGMRVTPDGVTATGISVKSLIRSAYNEWHDSLWSGEPAWTAGEYYDIAAKFDPADFKDLTDDQRNTMLQNMLAVRFKLMLHRETKILPKFALVVAKGGPKMQETKSEAIKLDEDKRLYCRAGLSVFRQCTMAEFANVVSMFGLNAVVEDKTGLTARYDFDLSWSPESAGTPSAPDSTPSIYEAVESQLGLRLQPTKGPVNTFVVDHVERPSEN